MDTPGAGLIIVLLNSSPLIETFAGTLIGICSSYIPDSTLIVICLFLTALPKSNSSPTWNSFGSIKNTSSVSLLAPALTLTICPTAFEVLPLMTLPTTKSLLFGWF